MEGDLAAQMVAGIDKFLLREIDLSVERRAKYWKRDFSSPEAYNKSIEPNRQRLAKILGVVDERVKFDAPELIATTRSVSEGRPGLVGKGENYEIFAVRWPAVRGVHGEGLLLVPKGEKVADIIAIPDADQTPEQICGLVEGVPPESQFARRLAENGCRVLVPTLISREMAKRAPPGQPGRANLTNREYLYRPAFELGRHLIGYEVQKVLAGVDWFAKEGGDKEAKIGVMGYGEGGMIALYAGALDTRIGSTCVSGYFGPRERIWEQPIDRNVFGLLEQFGDDELCAMVAPRRLVVDASSYPQVSLPSEGGAPAVLKQDFNEAADVFFKRLGLLSKQWQGKATWLTFTGKPDQAAGTVSGWKLAFPTRPKEIAIAKPVESLRETDVKTRQERQAHEIDRDTQQILAESPYVREKFMAKLAACKGAEEYSKVVEEYREIFATEVIGRFDNPLLEPNPRSRKSYETEKWVGYEVVLDVFPDVFAYGILCLPKDLKPGEKRPVVVCQHGLEGRPQDTIGEQGSQYYSGFAGKLADRGFVTFAPQNIYIGHDSFRTLQRKANPLGKTLFSIMVPQHQQICNWLKSQPFVDGDRIAFYGLSYGGKSAMRIPPLVKDYCLSICSADFNDWVDKNASTRAPYSYVWTGEYEIFEWDLGSTFNYAEMAALIAPRPFMVERGHFDGVGVDDRVAAEYAKVQRIYNVQLGMPDRCAIEWFVGPHKINGVGTYAFLHKHLNWPEQK
ncbi:MAG TPA: dienelactone hydrolase family protein, partial [Pirellulaceae bacterium]|nr:dienelactone hydrolase family protein [Pirellulaceae bacterium]